MLHRSGGEAGQVLGGSSRNSVTEETLVTSPEVEAAAVAEAIGLPTRRNLPTDLPPLTQIPATGNEPTTSEPGSPADEIMMDPPSSPGVGVVMQSPDLATLESPVSESEESEDEDDQNRGEAAGLALQEASNAGESTTAAP